MAHAIDILCQRLQDACKTGELVNLKYIYAAVTSDIIDGYCFARQPTKVLQRDFGQKFFDDIDSFLEVSLLVCLRHLAFVVYRVDGYVADHMVGRTFIFRRL
jgi:hypothetical protein